MPQTIAGLLIRQIEHTPAGIRKLGQTLSEGSCISLTQSIYFHTHVIVAVQPFQPYLN